MGDRRRISTAVWGVASLAAGGLMLEGGVREVVAYWPQRDMTTVVIGAAGALASAVLFLSAFGLVAGRPFGRKASVAAAKAMIPVHLLGFMLGLVGIPGALLGIVYPMVLLAAFTNRRDGEVPGTTDRDARPPNGPSQSDRAMRRVAWRTA